MDLRSSRAEAARAEMCSIPTVLSRRLPLGVEERGAFSTLIAGVILSSLILCFHLKGPASQNIFSCFSCQLIVSGEILMAVKFFLRNFHLLHTVYKLNSLLVLQNCTTARKSGNIILSK